MTIEIEAKKLKMHAIFFAEYLYNFLKVIPHTPISISLESEAPLIIEIADGGTHIRYMLAPCIEESRP